MNRLKVLTCLMLAVALFLIGCKTLPQNNIELLVTTEGRVSPNVLLGWIGEFSEDVFQKTIRTH